MRHTFLLLLVLGGCHAYDVDEPDTVRTRIFPQSMEITPDVFGFVKDNYNGKNPEYNYFYVVFSHEAKEYICYFPSAIDFESVDKYLDQPWGSRTISLPTPLVRVSPGELRLTKSSLTGGRLIGVDLDQYEPFVFEATQGSEYHPDYFNSPHMTSGLKNAKFNIVPGKTRLRLTEFASHVAGLNAEFYANLFVKDDVNQKQWVINSLNGMKIPSRNDVQFQITELK